MTAPVTHGYPDWGRYKSESDKHFLSDQLVIINGITVRPAQFVGDSPYVGAFFLTSVSNFRVQFSFFDAETGGTLLAAHTYDVRQGQNFTELIPVLGPWVVVQLDADVYPATYWLEFWAAPTAARPVDFDPIGSVLYSTFNTAFAPGTTTVDLTEVRPGPSSLYVDLPAVASSVDLFAVSYLGATTFISRLVGTGVSAERRPFLPPSSLRLLVVNTSGVNQNYTISLTTPSTQPS